MLNVLAITLLPSSILPGSSAPTRPLPQSHLLAFQHMVLFIFSDLFLAPSHSFAFAAALLRRRGRRRHALPGRKRWSSYGVSFEQLPPALPRLLLLLVLVLVLLALLLPMVLRLRSGLEGGRNLNLDTEAGHGLGNAADPLVVLVGGKVHGHGHVDGHARGGVAEEDVGELEDPGVAVRVVQSRHPEPDARDVAGAAAEEGAVADGENGPGPGTSDRGAGDRGGCGGCLESGGGLPSGLESGEDGNLGAVRAGAPVDALVARDDLHGALPLLRRRRVAGVHEAHAEGVVAVHPFRGRHAHPELLVFRPHLGVQGQRRRWWVSL